MENLFDVSGKVVLVTGGSRGIGEMIATGFINAGAKVYISARKAQACDELAAELSKIGTCISIPADLSSEAECKRLAEEIAKREAEMRKFWNNNFRVSPDGHLYREGPYNRNGEYTDWYAKAHASNTDLLCSEHARIHRLPHGETSSQMRTILQERVPSHLRRRTNATA